MADILLCHSVLGCRPAERQMAERLEVAGHQVALPDFYDGRWADTLDEGFAIKDSVGWSLICARAQAAADALPAEAVLMGVSMGASVAATVWRQRPETRGVLFLHGLGGVPRNARPGTPVAAHIAEDDSFAPAGRIAGWEADALAAGLSARVFTYPRAGHYFTDERLPDHTPGAAALTWERVLAFLARP